MKRAKGATLAEIMGTNARARRNVVSNETPIPKAESSTGGQFMPTKVQPVPKGFHTVTPYLVVNEAKRAIDFYTRAFGAKELIRMDGPNGKIGHAELKIGDSIVMLADEMPGSGNRSPKSLGGSPVGLMLYVDEVDAVFKQAISAGAKADQQPADQFWGDRYGKLTDPFGHQWSVATHIEDVSPQEMAKRMKQAMAKQPQAVS